MDLALILGNPEPWRHCRERWRRIVIF